MLVRSLKAFHQAGDVACELTQQVDDDLRLQDLRRRLHQRTVDDDVSIIAVVCLARVNQSVSSGVRQSSTIVALGLRNLSRLSFAAPFLRTRL